MGSALRLLEATAESPSEAIDRVRAQRLAERASSVELLREHITMTVNVSLTEMPMRDAVSWWSKRVGVNVVADWAGMEYDGVDVQAPVSLEVTGVSADRALLLIVSQQPGMRFIAELESWGVRLQTRDQANLRRVTRVYPVWSLLVPVPNFTDAPMFDLSAALSIEGGAGVFESSDTADDAEYALSPRERAEQLMTSLRESIEPDLWVSSDDEEPVATVRYHNGQLIIQAPRYVHAQIAHPS